MHKNKHTKVLQLKTFMNSLDLFDMESPQTLYAQENSWCKLKAERKPVS